MNKQALIWKSRRGLKELDLILQGFCDKALEQLSPSMLQSYQQLLELDDMTLLALLGGTSKEDDAVLFREELQQIIQLVRNTIDEP